VETAIDDPRYVGVVGQVRLFCERFRSDRSLYRTVLLFMALCLACASLALGQQTGAGSASSSTAQAADGSVVPRLITFSGTINPPMTQMIQNQAQTPGSSPAIGLTFSL